MTYHDDPDLERRLRRIAEGPEPPVPGSVLRYAEKVTSRKRGFQMRLFSNSRPRLGLVVGLASAAAILAVVGGFTFVLSNANNAAGSPTASQSAPATESPSASPSPSPTVTASPAPKSGDHQTKTMITARELHTATLLEDGRVLLAGGDVSVEGGLAPTNAAELYDPQSGEFTPTGSMLIEREAHTATLLADGRVLIAGGLLGDTSAELYDPQTGTFTATGSMKTSRNWATATLLADGRVLIAGGDSFVPGGEGPIASAEVYDPQTGQFTETGSMTTARDGHTATLLSNGLVLIAGGGNLDSNLASAELYNPKTGKFSRTGSMSKARFRHTATLLPNGLVLVAGGDVPAADAASPDDTAELFDPSTGKFRVTGSMIDPRSGHTATLLPDGAVLIAGGNADFSAGGVEKYDPSTGKFSQVIAGFYTTGGDSATLLDDGTVLFAGGGAGDDTLLPTAWVFVP